MPLYEYECERCSHRFEVIQGFSDPPLAECRKCGGPVRKLISAPAIQFKGTGWYITDYARKSSPSIPPSDSSSKEPSKETKTSSPEKTPTSKEDA